MGWHVHIIKFSVAPLHLFLWLLLPAAVLYARYVYSQQFSGASNILIRDIPSIISRTFDTCLGHCSAHVQIRVWSKSFTACNLFYREYFENVAGFTFSGTTTGQKYCVQKKNSGCTIQFRNLPLCI